MSVYTKITERELKMLLQDYDLGSLVRYEGIREGVTNTIYKVTTSNETLILTIFEKLQTKDLHFFIKLTTHLATHDCPVPAPFPRHDQTIVSTLKNKPALLQPYLQGQTLETPDLACCKQIATALAKIHLLTEDFQPRQLNPRGLDWFFETFRDTQNQLDSASNKLILNQLSFLKENCPHALPKGIIHADCFRDNVLFANNTLTAIIDWYYACYDDFIYDVAILINDWCITKDIQLDPEKKRAMLEAYQTVRPLSPIEMDTLPYMLQKAALRFWLSRLQDFLSNEMDPLLQIKDPDHFKKILLLHLN